MDLAFSPQLRSASTAVHLFGASILAYCFAARTGHITLKNWRQIPWGRWCIVLLFIDSWFFHACAGVLLQGPGADKNHVTCTMAIYLCIVIYCLSKILIYSFLIERVYVVWPHNGTRLSSRAYCLCLVMMTGYVVVVVLMIVGKNAFFNERHSCYIGLKSFASIPLLSYDLFLNVFLTSMFLWPLQQAHFRDVRLRKIARNTFCAAVVALTTSTINIAVLTIKHGIEPGWICLLSCGLDVTVNAMVLYWVTSYRSDDDSTNINYLTSISLPYTTRNDVTSTRPDPLAPPDLSVPAPVRDKTKPFRPAPVMTSRGVVTSQVDERRTRLSGAEEGEGGASVRERSVPSSAPTSEVESVPSQWAEQIGRVEYGKEERRWWWWRPWHSHRKEREVEVRVEEAMRTEVPFMVAVTTVHEVERRDSASTDGVGQDVYQ